MKVHKLPASVGGRDAERTRGNILLAAQKLFATKGYTTTGVREVAAVAGVDPTLIRRYFSSKEGLLRAAIEDFMHVEPFLAGDYANAGDRVVALLKAGEEIPGPLAVMMLATADEDARILCADLMYHRITLPLVEWLGGGPDAMARVSQINLLCIGYMSARQVLPLTELTGSALETTRDWLAKSIQTIIDGATAVAPTNAG